MKRILPLLMGAMLIGAIQYNDTVLHNDDRIVWMLTAPGDWGESEFFDEHAVYVLTAEVEVVPSRMELSDDPIPEYRLCIQQYGWNTMWPGEMTWGDRGKICLTKQYIAGFQGGEIPRLDISGWHEVNIDAGWINLNSEFGTIIDGEEAHTIFLPCIQN